MKPTKQAPKPTFYTDYSFGALYKPNRQGRPTQIRLSELANRLSRTPPIMSAATHHTDDERFGRGQHINSLTEEMQSFTGFRFCAHHVRPHRRIDTLLEY